ncbi:hypothetical protein [Aliiroseovarius sp. F20344]|uniref:hypothetical protein n=1 Tax=Aliiroseovarius sp. F20344 TaxID=2926414 RepID=UPI001FF412FB|nr:hypothetical protein [Aliiroseovarius sp. F20344]MCK0140989.1 hypothetical protein [Aliiroseovarius sp. F20344]
MRTAYTLVFLGTFVLSGCDSPSPQFMHRDTATTKVEVEGSVFSVHQRENWVEVYRTGFEALPRVPVILARSQVAIEQATGCKVVEGSLSGDQAIQRAEIDCDS